MDNQHDDFDKTSVRAGTHSAKWNSRITESGIIPLSVADMDIPAPPQVIKKLAELNKKDIYGYTSPSTNWNKIVTNWIKRQYQWKIESDWVVFFSRVIQAVSLPSQKATQYQDKTVVFSLFYRSVSNIVSANDRQGSESQLRCQNSRHFIGFDDPDSQSKNASEFISLPSGNLIGITSTNSGLTELFNQKVGRNAFIIADGVHTGFIINKNKNTPINIIDNDVKNKSPIRKLPTKPFNLAGLEMANIIIGHANSGNKFKKPINFSGIHHPGHFSMSTLNVAYNGIQLPENLYPKYFELHYGGKRTSPDELTQVSDSGK